MFSSQNRARALNTRLALATTKKGNTTIAEFVGKMRSLGDQMVVVGQPLEEDELVEYILTGLDADFNPIVSALIARKETITVSEAYQQLLAFETRMDMLGIGNSSGSSANTANRGGRDNGGRGNGRGNFINKQCQGNNGGGGRGSFFNRSSNGGNGKPTCQVCFKEGHTVDRCWHRFEENFVPDEKHASAAMNSYNVDTNWYTDTGATDHITGELEKLAVRE
jgi:hypothetical protein